MVTEQNAFHSPPEFRCNGDVDYHRVGSFLTRQVGSDRKVGICRDLICLYLLTGLQ